MEVAICALPTSPPPLLHPHTLHLPIHAAVQGSLRAQDAGRAGCIKFSRFQVPIRRRMRISLVLPGLSPLLFKAVFSKSVFHFPESPPKEVSHYLLSDQRLALLTHWPPESPAELFLVATLTGIQSGARVTVPLFISSTGHCCAKYLSRRQVTE